MKKVYAAIVLMNAMTSLAAQPNLTAVNFNPLVSEKADEFEFDTTGFDPGPAGNAITWNYPMLSGGPFHQLEVFSTFSTPHAPTFAASNVAVSRYALSYDYYLVNDGGQEYHGNGSSTAEIAFWDPATVYTFPFTYLTTSTDSFHAAFSSGGDPAVRKGQIVSTGDAYGTLLSPTGSYSDVLRVKSVWTFDDIVDNGTGDVIIHHEQVWYQWVTPGIHFPLLTYMREKIVSADSTQMRFYGAYLNPESITLDAGELDPDFTGFTLYPNPSNNQLVNVWFNSVSTQDVIVVVMNGAGEQVLSDIYYLSEGPNLMTLNTANLGAGIYFVEISSPGGKAVRRLVIR